MTILFSQNLETKRSNKTLYVTLFANSKVIVLAKLRLSCIPGGRGPDRATAPGDYGDKELFVFLLCSHKKNTFQGIMVKLL